MAERWYRWYDGTTRDGKFRLVADWVEESVATVLGVWASLLEDAATSNPRGTATRGIEYHSMYLDLNNESVKKIWCAFERVGTVRNAGNADDRSSAVLVVNWDARQFETDAKDPTAKERKERWKQLHKDKGTVRNGQERSGTPETETETETETEREEEAASENVLRGTSRSAPVESPKGHPTKYAFECGVIRLKEKDLESWKKAYRFIEVEAELTAMADWAARQDHWFNACSGLLGKRNREQKTKIDTAKTPGAEPKWRSGMEGVV